MSADKNAEVLASKSRVSPYRMIYDEEDVDNDIVLRAKQGDSVCVEHIMKKYKNFVKVKAKPFFIVGADKDDILQEGMIGLYKAIRDYDYERSVSFRSFADLCITRQIITAVKTATRQKHIPLNSYISLNKPIGEEDSDNTLLDIIANTVITNPEQLMISNEEIQNIEKKIQEILSVFEETVLSMYLCGDSYVQISQKMDKSAKSIDNALQRIKRKLEKYLGEREM